MTLLLPLLLLAGNPIVSWDEPPEDSTEQATPSAEPKPTLTHYGRVGYALVAWLSPSASAFGHLATLQALWGNSPLYVGYQLEGGLLAPSLVDISALFALRFMPWEGQVVRPYIAATAGPTAALFLGGVGEIVGVPTWSLQGALGVSARQHGWAVEAQVGIRMVAGAPVPVAVAEVGVGF